MHYLGLAVAQPKASALFTPRTSSYWKTCFWLPKRLNYTGPVFIQSMQPKNQYTKPIYRHGTEWLKFYAATGKRHCNWPTRVIIGVVWVAACVDVITAIGGMSMLQGKKPKTRIPEREFQLDFWDQTGFVVFCSRALALNPPLPPTREWHLIEHEVFRIDPRPEHERAVDLLRGAFIRRSRFSDTEVREPLFKKLRRN